MSAATELEHYLKTAQRYVESGENIIKSAAPDVEDVELHCDLFKRYIPIIERFRPKTSKDKDEAKFYENAAPVLDNIFIVQLHLERLEKKLNPQPVQSTSKHEIVPPQSVPQPLTIPAHSSIPHLKLQSFDGTKRQQYNRFKEIFKSVFDAAQMEDKQRFLRLQTYVTGEAADYVKHLPIVDESYIQAWAALDHEYDNAATLIAEIYHEIHTIKAATTDTKSLRHTFNAIEANLKALTSYGEKFENNLYLVNIIFQKFPTGVIYSLSTEEELTLPTFRKKMDKLIRIREQYSITSMNLNTNQSTTNVTTKSHQNTTYAEVKAKVKPTPEKESTAEPTTSSSSSNHKTIFCAFCKDSHFSDQCPTYMTHETRKARIYGACYNCLNKHDSEKCRRNRTCFYCRKQHHSSLCPTKFPHPQTSQQTGKQTTKEASNLNATSEGTYLTVLTSIQNPERNLKEKIRILIDCGTSRSYITERLVDTMQLQKASPKQMKMSRFNEVQENDFTTSTVSFILAPDTEYATQLTAHTTPHITREVPMFTPEQFCKQYPQHQNIEFAETGEEEPIDVLIGNDYAFRFITCKDKIEIDNLQIIHSVFGYLIAGQANFQTPYPTAILFSTATAIEQLASLDVLGIKDAHQTRDDEEAAATRQFLDTVKFTENRYEVPLLWRVNPVDFPGTFGLAIGRLKSQVHRLRSKTEILKAYDAIFRQQLAAGIIEKVNTRLPKNKSYYLPHQAVLNLEKSTTPLRIVYDASAHANKRAPSLNEAIYKGKNEIEDLTGILVRFRMQRIGLVSDIEKAYHAIQLREDDRDFCRFLWMKDYNHPITDENIETYRFRRIAFGLTSSQFILAMTIKYHIDRNPTPFSSQFKYDFYVDNLLTGTENEEAAIALYKTAVQLFDKCSMNLRCWATNSIKVRRHFEPSKLEEAKVIGILGLKWDTEADRLHLPQIVLQETNVPTLRSILKQTARIFDPLGLFSAVIIRAKILMKNIRIAGFVWDDPIPENLATEWNEIRNDFLKVSKHNVQRYVPSDTKTEIHAFSDASAKAYATAIYVKSASNVTLVFAKSRVAPIKPKPLTIPKLELLAATTAARAIRFIESSLRNTSITRRVLWIDSKCVIAQIEAGRIQAPYIHNRVKEINTEPKPEIRYVPSKENPADIPSRGVTFDELPATWWNGPSFLGHADEQWPENQSVELEIDTESEMKVDDVINLNIVAHEETAPIFDIDPKKFNSWNQFLTRGTHCMRFLAAKMPKFVQRFPDAINKPRTLFLKWCLLHEQRRHYATVFQNLENQKFDPLVKQFRLQVDKDGLLRCRGRFELRPVPDAVRFPVLLPPGKHSHLTHLIITQAHEDNFHTGTNHTLAAIRKQYWLPRGRADVYNAIRKCRACKRYTARPYPQPTDSNLPAFRITANQQVWSNIGMDILGHFYVEQEKVWILLTTCLVSRAVSLEPMYSLSAQHTILALRSFIARRGVPQLILSDQGSQFQPAIETLQANTTYDIVWKKIPGQSPWFGAAYERLVGITKSAFNRTFHNASISKYAFRTILFEVENAINDRPITYVENDIGFEPLTPNCFLSVRSLPEEKQIEATSTNLSGDRAILQALWKSMNNTKNHFWKDWSTRYLAFLRERHEHDQCHFKKATTTSEPKIGEIVLVAETNIKRGKWHLAKITELPRSADGKIRSATLLTGSKRTISRPIQNIYPLEIISGQDEISDTATTSIPEPAPQLDDEEITEIEVEIQEDTDTETSGTDEDPDEIISVEVDVVNEG